jgi:hypothetical protein
MFDARAQEITRSPNNSMNGAPFSQKQFSKVRTILAGDAVISAVFGFRFINSPFVQHQSAKAIAGTRTNPGLAAP